MANYPREFHQHQHTIRDKITRTYHIEQKTPKTQKWKGNGKKKAFFHGEPDRMRGGGHPLKSKKLLIILTKFNICERSDLKHFMRQYMAVLHLTMRVFGRKRLNDGW